MWMWSTLRKLIFDMYLSDTTEIYLSGTERSTSHTLKNNNNQTKAWLSFLFWIFLHAFDRAETAVIFFIVDRCHAPRFEQPMFVSQFWILGFMYARTDVRTYVPIQISKKPKVPKGIKNQESKIGGTNISWWKRGAWHQSTMKKWPFFQRSNAGRKIQKWDENHVIVLGYFFKCYRLNAS